MSLWKKLFSSKESAKSQPKAALTAIRLHEVIDTMCTHPQPSFRNKEEAASLYKLLPNSHIPKQVADLFVEVTTFTAAFTGIRLVESMEALEQLCQVRSPVVDNLLNCIAQMADAEHRIEAIEAIGPLQFSVRNDKETTHVSFEAQRQKARQELKKRGRPTYNPKHYYDVSERIITIEMLAASAEPDAVTKIVGILHVGDSKEKRAAVNALGKIGNIEAVDQLLIVFQSEKDSKIRRATVRALVSSEATPQSAEATATMLSCLGDSDAAVRQEALQWLKNRVGSWRKAISQAQITEVRQKLLQWLQDMDINVRYHAIDSLGEVGAVEDVALLESCTKDLKSSAIPKVKESVKKIKQRSLSHDA